MPKSLDDARHRAISMALATLPEGTAENRAKNRAIIKAVRRERELYPWRFSDAGERYTRGDWSIGRQWEPAAPEHWGEMPNIRAFLKREVAMTDISAERVRARQAAEATVA